MPGFGRGPPLPGGPLRLEVGRLPPPGRGGMLLGPAGLAAGPGRGPDGPRGGAEPPTPKGLLPTRAERGPGVHAQRHRLSVRAMWDLEFADRLSGAARALARDWQLSFVLTAQSGQPYSGMVNADLNNDGNPSNDRTPGSPRDSFYAPSTVSLDPRLTRTVHLGSRASLRLGWEAFNVFNHVNLGLPNSTIDQSNAGQITSVQVAMRQMQFGLHFQF